VQTTILKQNAENARILAKILPYAPQYGFPLIGASHLFLGLHP